MFRLRLIAINTPLLIVRMAATSDNRGERRVSRGPRAQGVVGNFSWSRCGLRCFRRVMSELLRHYQRLVARRLQIRDVAL